MIKGFIHNFPCQNNQLQLQVNSKCNQCGKQNCKHYKIHLGFQGNLDNNRKLNLINQIFNAILLNDKLVLLADDSFWLFQLFNLQQLRKLFEANVFQIINDKISHFIIREGKRKSAVGHVRMQSNYIDVIEAKLAVMSPGKSITQSGKNILYNIEANQLRINENEIRDQIEKETNHDLQIVKLRKKLKIHSKDLDDIRKADILKILNLFYNNRALNVASALKADNIILDPSSKTIIESKLRPSTFKSFFQKTDSINIFEEINSKKELPNLGELFINEIIDIDDIIQIRDNIEGQLFRAWFHSNEYDRAHFEKTLLNNKEQSKIVKYTNKVRWVIPPIVGVVGGIPSGIVAAYANSKFVSKFLNGWHPNLFLDNVLRSSIDEKHSNYIKSNETALKLKRNQKIGRNDPCPCRSGNKYKKCCGKNK